MLYVSHASFLSQAHEAYGGSMRLWYAYSAMATLQGLLWYARGAVVILRK